MKPYATNGELIAAALYLRFDIERQGNKSPNVNVAVAPKDVRRNDPRDTG